MEIRKSTESDKAEIKKIYLAAFGNDEGPVIARLVNDLFNDKTALPLLSLVAVKNDRLLGHILFTNVKITQTEESVSAQILAPLAVLPTAQKSGIGTKLIKKGLAQLKNSGVELVFVLGQPTYYPRCGFFPAGEKGYDAPHPIPKEHATAWMVQQLNGNSIGKVKGTVQCSEVLNRPEHWRE